MQKLKLILLLSIACLTASAQSNNQPINLPKYDKQWIHFGFLLGINSAGFTVDRVADLKVRDTIFSVNPERVSGLNLGIVSNLRIGEHFDFRFLPSLSFNQRNLLYDLTYNDTLIFSAVKKVESTYLDFPFDIKFKSKRVNNYRVYAVAGFKFGIDMVSQAKVKVADKDIVKLKRNDYGYQVGLGMDFYLPYFKFSPEIKMYTGMANILQPENTVYASPLDALRSKIFLISFFFE